MSAVQNFPRNTNPAALESGLILQGKAAIDTNTAGLSQTTLNFLCLNRQRRLFTQSRYSGKN